MDKKILLFIIYSQNLKTNEKQNIVTLHQYNKHPENKTKQKKCLILWIWLKSHEKWHEYEITKKKKKKNNWERKTSFRESWTDRPKLTAANFILNWLGSILVPSSYVLSSNKLAVCYSVYEQAVAKRDINETKLLSSSIEKLRKYFSCDLLLLFSIQETFPYSGNLVVWKRYSFYIILERETIYSKNIRFISSPSTMRKIEKLLTRQSCQSKRRKNPNSNASDNTSQRAW